MNAGNNETSSAEVTYIPVAWCDTPVGAAAYLAILAYPTRAEWPKRDEFIEAVKADVSKRAIARGYERSLVPPQYRRFKNEKVKGVWNRAIHRIQARCFSAVVMAEEMAIQGALKAWITLPKMISPPVQIALARVEKERPRWQHCHSDRGGGGEISSIYRAWAHTKPVLHLAWVYSNHCYQSTPVGSGFDPMFSIFNPSWVARALEEAEDRRTALHHSVPTFDPEAAVRLLADDQESSKS